MVTIFRAPDIPENVPEELMGLKKRIYEIFQAHPRMSRTQTAAECGRSVKTAGHHLAEMEKSIRHVGLHFRQRLSGDGTTIAASCSLLFRIDDGTWTERCGEIRPGT